MTHCTPKQAQALKELGFDLPVRDFYNTKGCVDKNFNSYNWNDSNERTSAPTPYEALEWFREKKGIDAWVFAYWTTSTGKRYGYEIFNMLYAYGLHTTHSEALNALIDKLIEIVKQNQDGRNS